MRRELLALRVNDIDFGASTLRIGESSDQQNKGIIGSFKNSAAYRTVLEDVQAEFSSKFGKKIDVLENMENEAGAVSPPATR